MPARSIFMKLVQKIPRLPVPGQAARAQDAATIVTNPAGMTRLPDHMFTGGLQAMDGDISYKLDARALATS